MSAQIESRPVLRPAGNNISLIHHQTSMDGRPASTRKPPPSPPLKPVQMKIPPPSMSPLLKSPVLKPCPSPAKAPKKCPSPGLKPCPSPRPPQPYLGTEYSVHVSNSSPGPAFSHAAPRAPPLDLNAPLCPPSPSDSLNSAPASASASPLPSPSSSRRGSPSLSRSSSSSSMTYLTSSIDSAYKLNSPKPRPAPRITLTRSSSDVSRRHPSSTTTSPVIKPSKPPLLPRSKSFGTGSRHSYDEAVLAELISAKKVAASELSAQRRLKVAEYGRKLGKPSRVAPEAEPAMPITTEPQRCKFITAQSDPLYVAYHDEEWGVPVHDDRKLFELLVLAGAQAELSWSTILHQRDNYREVFCGYDPEAISLFTEKRIQLLESDRNLLLPGGKIRGVVENAKRILEVASEFGSLDNYLWGFLNYKPMANSYRYPKQVPVKTSKAEWMSKDLVKRGFRNVGATIVYSFMQAAGMTNDHLVQCFRYQECIMSSNATFQDSAHECGVEDNVLSVLQETCAVLEETCAGNEGGADPEVVSQ